MTHIDPELPAPTVPPIARTVAYVVGAAAGLGAGPALLAFGLTEWAGVAFAVSGAANAIAFGYRPTRT